MSNISNMMHNSHKDGAKDDKGIRKSKKKLEVPTSSNEIQHKEDDDNANLKVDIHQSMTAKIINEEFNSDLVVLQDQVEDITVKLIAL